MKRRAFTLIEILVAVGIIAVLATIMVAVGSSVQKNARINETRVTIKAVEGLVEEFERDNNFRFANGTVYATSASGWVTIKNPTTSDISASDNYANILSRRSAMTDISGTTHKGKSVLDKISTKISHSQESPNQLVFILDAWKNPINFFPQGWAPVAGVAPASRSYLRSSGPDMVSNFANPSDPVNSDDIYSYEP